MIKCPFCHFDNEDGALFCDQCKSDLSSVAPTPVLAVPIPAVPIPVEVVPVVVDAVPIVAEPIDVIPVLAEAVSPQPVVPVLALDPVSPIPVIAEVVPVLAEPVPLSPVIAEPVAAVPVMPITPPPVVPMPVPVPVAPVPVAPIPVAPVPVAPVPVAPVPVQAIPAPPVPVPAPAPVPPAPVAAGAGGSQFPPNAQPRLLVMRGVKRNVEYPIFEGPNFVGRSDEKPVDIDLEEQEPPDRVWCSRQHCCLFFENNELAIEDLNSSNGTFVNRVRLYPGQKKVLVAGDVVQIGNVQMKVVV